MNVDAISMSMYTYQYMCARCAYYTVFWKKNVPAKTPLFCGVLQYASVGAVCRKQFQTCGTALSFSFPFFYFLVFSPHSAFSLYKQCVTLYAQTNTHGHTQKYKTQVRWHTLSIHIQVRWPNVTNIRCHQKRFLTSTPDSTTKENCKKVLRVLFFNFKLAWRFPKVRTLSSLPKNLVNSPAKKELRPINQERQRKGRNEVETKINDSKPKKRKRQRVLDDCCAEIRIILRCRTTTSGVCPFATAPMLPFAPALILGGSFDQDTCTVSPPSLLR